MPVQYYIFLSIALFCIGVMGVLMRRNAIIIFMCIELMLHAVNLLVLSFSTMWSDAGNKATGAAHNIVFFIMVVAAAEVAVGLSHITMVYRNTHSVALNILQRLKN